MHRPAARVRRVVLVLLGVTLGGCSLFGSHGAAGGDGRLLVQMTDLTTTGRSARIRGTVVNHYSERVDGVRYVVTMRDKQEPPTILERDQRQVDTVIEAGGRAPIDLVVEGPHFADKTIRIAITATPVRLGSKAVPPPEGWEAEGASPLF